MLSSSSLILVRTTASAFWQADGSPLMQLGAINHISTMTSALILGLLIALGAENNRSLESQNSP